MNDTSQPPIDDELVTLRSIDAEADRFEALWRAEMRPAIEPFLKKHPPAMQARLLAELLAIEWEWLARSGMSFELDAYQRRFADHADLVSATHATREKSDFEQSTSHTARDQQGEGQFSTIGHREHGTAVNTAGSADQPPSTKTPPIPEQIGRYRVVRRLGTGAMGSVYLVRDEHLHRDVALKVPKFEGDRRKQDAIYERFLREARAAATINHRNICAVHDIGEAGGLRYITMAYIDGDSLAAVISRGEKYSERQVAELGQKLALALQVAHDAGVVHRDLKPANIMIDKRNEPIITDFGLALLLDREGDARITHSGMLVGSPAYMSPEQVSGQHDTISAVTDIYSLGVVLYELLCGRLPYQGTVLAVISQIQTKPPPDIASLRENADPELISIADRMMARSPSDRYSSMQQAADDLSRWLTTHHDDASHVDKVAISLEQTEPTTGMPCRRPSATYRKQPTFARTRNRLLTGAPVIAIGMCAFLALWAVGIIFKVETVDGVILVEIDSTGKPVEVNVTKDRLLIIQDPNDGREIQVTVDRNSKQLRLEKSGFQIAVKHFSLETLDGRRIKVSFMPNEGWRGWPANAPPPAISPFDTKQAKRHQENWAKYLGVPVEQEFQLDDEQRLSMILIPPGEFLMGSTKETRAIMLNEAKSSVRYQWDSILGEVQHRVAITQPFYLAKTELTQSQWEVILGSNPASFKDPSRPVENVSWNEILEFMKKVNHDPTDRNHLFRLPTEAEWEYGCRGGSSTLWQSGNGAVELLDHAWFNVNAKNESHPVSQLAPNRWGLHDMHGNVWEWCADWYDVDSYGRSPQSDPLGPRKGSRRVHRGGAWNAHAGLCRSGYRDYALPDYRKNDLGFRLAMTIVTSRKGPRTEQELRQTRNPED